MLKIPVMSKIFDVVEESRAKPNGRSPFVDEIKKLRTSFTKRWTERTSLWTYIFLQTVQNTRRWCWKFRAAAG